MSDITPTVLIVPGLRDHVALHWQTLLENWSDLKAHDRFLAQAMELGELPTAGRLYRIRLARSPGDPEATRGRDDPRAVTAARESAHRWPVAAVLQDESR